MAEHGFIQDKLEIKILILYIVSRMIAPVSRQKLTDQVLCIDGVNYFDFVDCLQKLVKTEHLLFENELYSVTEKGRRNGAICESSIAYSVRLKCDKNLAKFNADVRRDAQVRATVLPRDDGALTLRLAFDDELGNILTVDLMTVSADLATKMGERFRAEPTQVYNGLLDLLSGEK